jgi:hypothetical protein
LQAPHREAAGHPVVHVDGEHVAEYNAVIICCGGFTLKEGHVLRQFVLNLNPGQRQGLAVGNLYLEEYFFTEKYLALAQATPVFDAVEAKTISRNSREIKTIGTWCIARLIIKISAAITSQ